HALRWLGKRSYGIYLWHWPAVVLALHWSLALSAPVTIGFALVAGAISWGLVERPFLTAVPRRDLVLRRAVAGVRVSAAVLGVIAVVVMVARLPGTDPIAASLRRGEKVLATQAPPPVVDQETTTTQSTAAPSPSSSGAPRPVQRAAAPRPARAAAPPTPTVPRPPPPPVPVTAVGDSVMVGAAPALHDRLGANGFIDARVSRQFDEGIRVVHDLHAQGRL